MINTGDCAVLCLGQGKQNSQLYLFFSVAVFFIENFFSRCVYFIWALPEFQYVIGNNNNIILLPLYFYANRIQHHTHAFLLTIARCLSILDGIKHVGRTGEMIYTRNSTWWSKCNTQLHSSHSK